MRSLNGLSPKGVNHLCQKPPESFPYSFCLVEWIWHTPLHYSFLQKLHSFFLLNHSSSSITYVKRSPSTALTQSVKLLAQRSFQSPLSLQVSVHSKSTLCWSQINNFNFVAGSEFPPISAFSVFWGRHISCTDPVLQTAIATAEAPVCMDLFLTEMCCWTCRGLKNETVSSCQTTDTP